MSNEDPKNMLQGHGVERSYYHVRRCNESCNAKKTKAAKGQKHATETFDFYALRQRADELQPKAATCTLHTQICTDIHAFLSAYRQLAKRCRTLAPKGK